MFADGDSGEKIDFFREHCGDVFKRAFGFSEFEVWAAGDGGCCCVRGFALECPAEEGRAEHPFDGNSAAVGTIGAFTVSDADPAGAFFAFERRHEGGIVGAERVFTAQHSRHARRTAGKFETRLGERLFKRGFRGEHGEEQIVRHPHDDIGDGEQIVQTVFRGFAPGERFK